VGVGDVDGDERDVGSCDLVRDHRSYVLVHLKFDDDVYLAADELFSILESCRCIVFIVEDEEVDTDGDGRILETLGDLVGEGHIRTLASKAEAHLFGAGYLAIGSIRGLREIASMHKGLEHSIDRCLGDACLPMDRFERHRLAFGL